MKNSLVSSIALSVGFLAASPVFAQTTVFDDVFDTGDDTFQSATPAAPEYNSGDSYASYEYFQSANAPVTPTVSGDELDLTGVSGTSEFSELEAQFTSDPILLGSGGYGYIDLSITFVDTANIMPVGNTAATLNIGLYNSGGVAPDQGAELNSSGEPYTTGTGGWQGYVGRVSSGSGTPEILTRNAQTATPTNPNQEQDVLFNDASSSSTYDAPKGAEVQGGSGAPASLVQGDTYTDQLRFTLGSGGNLTILNELYLNTGFGAGEAGESIYSNTGSTTGGALTTTFDSLAFGWRFDDSTAAANGLDIDQILVTVPEPSTLALAGAGLGLLGLIRFRRIR